MGNKLSGIDWLESLLETEQGGVTTAGDVTPLTPEHVTTSDAELTAEPVTATPKPKRAYKPRARCCECGCGELVTPTVQHPNKRFFSDTCRQRARRAKLAKQQGGDVKPKERTLEMCVCLWCGDEFLADPTKRPKYHQKSSCKELAYRQRRISAIEAVATIRNYSPDKSARVVAQQGMKRISHWLQRQGYQYNDSLRRWLVPMGVDVMQG